jgi:hypothetical protein
LSDLVCTVIWTMSAGRQVKPWADNNVEEKNL